MYTGFERGIEMDNSLKKPLLRGYFHQEAFFVAVGACCLLIAKSSHAVSYISSIVYSIGLMMLLGISALYHRHHWPPKQRAIMKRFDHSAIFILIAGTFTPLCLLALPVTHGEKLLMVVWAAALLGIIQSIFWVQAPKWVSALLYIIMGWLALPYLGELKLALGEVNLLLILLGGIVYTVGAFFYAFKRPNFIPLVFGYHELFHLFVVVAAALHFIVIYRLIQ
jgi:hemolysin III